MAVDRAGAVELHEVDADDIETALPEVGVLRDIKLDAVKGRRTVGITAVRLVIRVALGEMAFAGGRCSGTSTRHAERAAGGWGKTEHPCLSP